MAKEVIGVQGSGPKVGRFLTRAVKVNGLVFTTLHHGFDPIDYDPTIESGSLPEDIGSQTKFALEELGKVLVECGTSLSRALRVTVYINSHNEAAFAQMDAAYNDFFRERGIETLPARTAIRAGLADHGIAMDVVAGT